MSAFAAPIPAQVPKHLRIGNPDIVAADNYLLAKNWPVGLRQALIASLRNYPIRFLIVDDSGSMKTGDGKRILEDGRNTCMVDCSRWEELVPSALFVAELADAARAPTEFHLLNNLLFPPPISVGFDGDANGNGLAQVRQVSQSIPTNGTPLCRHVNDVVDKVRALAPQLRDNNQKAVVVIATDGEAGDGDISAALRPIKDLPVQLILRLCTNEENIVNYWNNIDQDLELDMDVLDDLSGEAGEVAEHNKWLTYAEPLHLLRLFGVSVKEFDILDERKLTSEEMRKIVTMILTGGDVNQFSDPDINFRLFMYEVEAKNSLTVWCPIRGEMRPWIDMRMLQRAYSNERNSCCCVII